MTLLYRKVVCGGSSFKKGLVIMERVSGTELFFIENVSLEAVPLKRTRTRSYEKRVRNDGLL